jgi:ligand-binding sensor domain-containing protein
VYAVTARQERVTVGTARGLVRVDDSMRVERLVPDFSDPVVALFPVGDSIWVGTGRGLFLATPGARNVTRPATLANVSLQPAIVAMAALGDTIVALSRDQLLWRNPRTNAWSLGPNLSGVLGRLCCLVADGSGFWIAGERGIGFARLNAPALRALHEGDLPAVTNDLAVDARYLWVATDGGLVRFALTAIRP